MRTFAFIMQGQSQQGWGTQSQYLSARVSQNVSLPFQCLKEAHFKFHTHTIASPVSSIWRVNIDEHKGPKICEDTPASNMLLE